MKELLNRFENKAPEIVFEWHDAETPAKGWVVINSLRGGAAGGGTRMRKGLDRREVESLAKTMEVKFSVSGPTIGGAKSGIDFDPADPRKDGVLRRWYQAVMPLLKTYYGTGGDLNVDEVHEVIPITESYGLWHPQEGVVNGPYLPSDSERIQKVGRVYGGSVEGKRVVVQGWGNVGAAAAWYLAQAGAKVVGIRQLRHGARLCVPDAGRRGNLGPGDLRRRVGHHRHRAGALPRALVAAHRHRQHGLRDRARPAGIARLAPRSRALRVALPPPAGGNTSGPAKPVPRCFGKGRRAATWSNPASTSGNQ